MIRLLMISLVPLFLNACSYNWGATTEIKKASFKAHQEQWQLDKPLRATLLSRSVQIFHADQVSDEEGKSLPPYGGSGLACFVTSDGYALTAKHCVNTPQQYVLASNRNDLGKHLFYVGMAKLKGKVYDRNGKFLFNTSPPGFFYRFWNSEGSVDLGFELKVEKIPVRIVHKWPDSDLALIKVPLSDQPHFTLADSPPARGDVLFAPGNPMNEAPRPSAGQLLRLSQKKNSYRLMTSIPVTPGDSGGPAADTLGNLVGVASKGYATLNRSWPRFTNSSFIRPKSAELQRLIEEDRRKN